jgi:ribosomal protein L19
MFNIPRILSLDYLKTTPVNKNLEIGNIVRVDFNKLQFFSTEKSTSIKAYSKAFLGVCISRTKKAVASTFTLRNVIQKQPIEATFYLNSSFIYSIKKYKQRKGVYRSARVFFLRKKALHYSRIKLRIKKN